MSIPLRIAATFDGTTITTLENAVQVPEERLFELVVPLAGLIRLWTFQPVGARDLFLQTVSVKDIPPLATATLELVFPSGVTQAIPMVASGDQAVVMNVVVPQGALLSVDVRLAGAAVPAVVEIWIYGINDKTYAPLACCHFFAPNAASELAVLDEGVLVSDPTAFLNFVGAGVTAVAVGDGVEVTIPGGAAGTKSVFYTATNYDAEHGDFRVRNIGGAGAFNFSFCVPADFGVLVDLVLVAIPDGTDAAADIDLNSDYGAPGEAFDNHSESDAASTFPLTVDELLELDISSVFSALGANDYCGIEVDHQGLGFSVDYVGIVLRYTPV